MKRLKEILYTLVLGMMVLFLIQSSLVLVEKPSTEQRIPVVSAASYQLSAQPYFLIRQLLGSELLEVKDQAAIQAMRSLIKKSRKTNRLDNIQMDWKKSMSIVLVNEPSYKKTWLHFQANKAVNGVKKGKHYVQIDQDVFYFPSTTVSPADVAWLQKHVSWEQKSITDGQLILSKFTHGKQDDQVLQWNDHELRISMPKTTTNRSLILSPRFFHYSNEVPASLIARITADYSMRGLLVNLNRISVNYENGTLTEDEQFAFAPSFEALLEYQTNEDLACAIKSFKSDFPKLIWTENTVQLGTQTYYFKETSPKSLYICSDKSKYCSSGIPILTRCQTGFLCKGDLSRLTSIQNTGWAGLVLDMIPAFRASKTLFDETKEIQTEQGQLILRFKNGHFVLHEFLRAFLAYAQE